MNSALRHRPISVAVSLDQPAGADQSASDTQDSRRPPLWNCLAPAVRVRAAHGRTIFEVTLPRVEPKGIRLEFVHNVLTLRAACVVKGIDSDEALSGIFMRRFGMSEQTDTARITAHFARGMLTIVAPHRREASLSRPIPISIAA